MLHRAARALEGIDVEAVVVELDRDELGSHLPQAEQRAIVGRRLDHHLIAGLDEQAKEERVGLKRPVGGDHVLGPELAVGDPLDERPVPSEVP